MTRAHPGNVLHLGLKELISLWRDRPLLVVLVWTFTFGIYVTARAASLELHDAPIAVVDEDRSPLSRQIADAFRGPYFRPPVPIDRAEVDPGLDAGRFTFVLDVPPDFQRDVVTGRQPAIQLNVDATRMTQAFIGTTYVQRIVAAEVDHFLRREGLTSASRIEQVIRVRFNPNLNGVWFGGVMEIINNITLLSIILTGAALIREREHGTLEHLLVMPLHPIEIMAAKVWANGAVVLAAAAFALLVVVRGLLEVPIAGSVPLFLFGATLHLFSTTSIGIFLGTVARSMPQLGLLIILVIVPLQLLSGGVTPRESMPEAVQTIMLLAPTTHFVEFAQAILYRGAGLEVVWPSFLAIAIIGAVFFLAALARFRRSVTLTQI
ncbi:MAG TPA: ABC transporter permease [Thermodesulfobacteriota bacterium]